MAMPHITGDRLARKIKKIRPDMPVILCTGFSEKINVGRASALNIDGFLMKPFSQVQLANTVRSVLDLRL
jgi:DNA-binding NarL/FixJ family response regulator